MNRSKLIILVISTLLTQSLFAQDCSVKLRDAQNLFNAGLVEDIPDMLEECLQNNAFTQVEEQFAYQLLVRTYLFEDEIEKADDKMLDFLKNKNNPEYLLRPTDNSNFGYLFNTYTVKPIVQISASLGSNLPFLSISDKYSLASMPKDKKYLSKTFGFVASLEAKFKLLSKIEIGAGIDFSTTRFKYNEDFLNFTKVFYSETETRIAVPIQLYFYPFTTSGGLSPFVKFGGAISYNISSKATQETINPSDPSSIRRAEANIDKSPTRTTIEPIIIGGLGFKYKLPHSYVFADLSVHLGTLNQTNSGELSNAQWYLLSTDDNFKLNSLRITIGYTYILYKPFKNKVK